MTLGIEQEKNTTYPFSETAKRVFEYAKINAQKHKNLYLSTDHLILGLVIAANIKEGIASDLFNDLNIDIGRLQKRAEKKMYEGNSTAIDPKLTPSCQKVFELAALEIKKSGDTKIRPVHILIGLLQHGMLPTHQPLSQQKTDYYVYRLRNTARNQFLKNADRPL
jgi:ATP-dependent Clp protease ATP-binding subunit ClpA